MGRRTTLLLLAGLASCKDAPKLESLEPAAHLGVRRAGAQLRWLYPPKGPFELWVRPAAAVSALELRVGEARVDFETEILSRESDEARVRLEAKGMPDDGWPPGTLATLDAGKLELALELVPDRGSWPRVQSAETTEALEAIVGEPEHPLEAIAALYALSKRAEDAAGYARAQQRRMELAEGWGFPSAAAEAAASLAYRATQGGDQERATGLLERALDQLGELQDADARAKVLQISGYVAVNRGNYREADRVLQASAELATRHGNEVVAAFATNELAIVAASIGDFEAADLYLHHVQRSLAAVPPRVRLGFEINRAYLEAERAAAIDTSEAWARAARSSKVALKRARATDDTVLASIGALNLALALDRAGDRAGALEALELWGRSREAAPARVQSWGEMLEIRLEPDPNIRANRLGLLLENESLTPELEWRIYRDRGVALVAAHHPREARAALDAALETLDRLSLGTDLRADRGGFFEARSGAFSDAVQAWLGVGDTNAAFELDDRARATFLRGYELSARARTLEAAERRRWQEAVAVHRAAREEAAARLEQRDRLAVSELAAFDAESRALEARTEKALDQVLETLDAAGALPAPVADRRVPLSSGERLLSFSRVGGRDGVFEVDAKHTRWVELPEGASSVLERPDLEHTYLVPGPGAALEHLVRTWMPRLLAHQTVSLLPTARLASRAERTAWRPSVVIGDPDGSLPSARAEASAVAERLGVRLWSPDAGLRPLLGALEGAKVFHFSGHGTVDRFDPFSIALELGPAGALRLEDMLALGSPPRLTVLSGCETGIGGHLGAHARLGLPDLLLLAGAEAVVASVEVVDDAAAARFAAAFYAAGGAEQPIPAFRAAFLKTRKKDGPSFFVAAVRR